jgi:hypothetical protein
VDSSKSFKIPQDNLRYFKQKNEHLQQTENRDKSSVLNTDRTRKAKPSNTSAEKADAERLFESTLKTGSRVHSPKLINPSSGMKKSATHSALTPASISKQDYSKLHRDNSYFTKAMKAHYERQSAISAKENNKTDAIRAAPTDRTVKHSTPFQRASQNHNPVQIGKNFKEKLQRELAAVKSKIQSSNQTSEAQSNSKSYSKIAVNDKKKSKLGFLKELFAPAHRGCIKPPHKQSQQDVAFQILCRFEELSKARLGAFNPFEAKTKPPRVYGFRESILKETNEIFTIVVRFSKTGISREGKSSSA